MLPSKVQLICEVVILKNGVNDVDTDIAVAVCQNMLIIAGQA